MNELNIEAFPVNNSWYMFKQNWLNIIRGGFFFILKNPFSCWPILRARLAYAIFKKSLTKPTRVPEGFQILNNRELLMYGQIFIERNLAYQKMLTEFADHKKWPLPLYVLDVGSNVGLFSQFMGRYNIFAEYHLFEPMPNLNTRAAQLNWNQSIIGKPRSHLFLTLNEKAVSTSSKLDKTLNVGHLVSIRDMGSQKIGEFKPDTISLNEYCEKIIPIFCLKIDTDGMNHEVLMGAKKILSRIRWVLIERDEEYCYCEEILTRFGFKFQCNSSPDDAVWFNENAQVNWTYEFRQQKGLPAFSQPELPNLNLESKYGGSC